MMNITVNGKAVELEEGSRALEAAKAHSPNFTNPPWWPTSTASA